MTTTSEGKWWEFLTSVRFWKAAAGAVVLLLVNLGVIPIDIAEPILVLLGTSIGLNTIDRFSKKEEEYV